MSLPADIQEKFDWVVSFMTVEDRFCFQVLAMMDKIPDESIPTMGVRPTAIGVELRFNPEFIRQMEIQELRFVLTHEVFHVVLHHITKRAPNDPHEHEIHNIAADLAINSLIKDEYGDGGKTARGNRYAPRHKEDVVDNVTGKVIAKKGDRMGCFPSDPRFGFDPELSMENYVHLLRDKFPPPPPCPVHGQQPQQPQGGDGDKENKCGGQQPGEGEQLGDKGDGKGHGEEGEQPGGGGSGEGEGSGSGHSHGKGPQCTCKQHGVAGLGKAGFDDHGGWEPNEIVDERIRRQVEMIDKSNGWGSMSAGMIEMIKAAQSSEVPWRKLLKHYLGMLVTSNVEPTFKKPNKRFGYPYCGNKRKSTDRKLVAIDTSGSVGSKDLEKFLTEINSLSQIQPVDLMLFDSQLQYPKAIPFNKKHARFDFKGRGGTAFTPVFEYAQENRYRSLIVLTDGQAEQVEKPSKMDVLWVLTPGNEPPVEWGRVVRMKKSAD